MEILLRSLVPRGWKDRDANIEVRRLEELYQCVFPRSYREFLLMTNGGRLSVRCGMHAIPGDDSTAFEVYDFLSIGDRKPRALEYSPFWLDVYEEGSPATYFPIGTTTADEFISLDFSEESTAVCLFSFGRKLRLADDYEQFVRIVERTIEM